MASFGSAFAAARKAGKKTFVWQGKSYHTKTKEEMSSAPSKSLKPVGRGGKPSVDSTSPKAPGGSTAIKPVRVVAPGSKPAGKPAISAGDAKADRPSKPATSGAAAPKRGSLGKADAMGRSGGSGLVAQARETLAASRRDSVERTRAAMEAERKKLAARKK